MNESDWTEKSKTDRLIYASPNPAGAVAPNCYAKHSPVWRSGIEGTLNERGQRYGVFSKQATIAQSIKDCFRNCPSGWGKLAPDQKEALDMVANKIARILNGDPDYHDSWHDIEGYVKLVADRLNKETK